MHLYDLPAGVPWLSLIWLSLLVPAIIMMFLKQEQKDTIRLVGASFAFVSLVLSVLVYLGYDYTSPQKLQFVEELPWLPQLGINYILGVYPAPIMDLANQAATALAAVFTRALT